MKKLVFMMAVVIAVASAQAGELTWNVTNVKGGLSVNDGLVASAQAVATGSMVYIFVNSGASATPMTADAVIGLGQSGVAAAATSSSTIGTTGLTGSQLWTTAGTPVSFYAVVFNGTDGSFVVTGAKNNITIPGTGGSAVQAISLVGLTWQAVPEPTAAALLAIGAAVVGLRRKVRA